MRHIVATDVTRYLFVLLILGGFFNSLDRASNRSIGDRMPWLGIVALTLIGALLAIPLSTVAAIVMRWAAQKLGGVATREQVRASVAWAGAPLIMFNLVAWPVQLALYGGELFTTETPLMDDSNPFVVLALAGTAIVVAIWSLVVGLKVFAEVNRFSAWRAAGAVMLLVAIIGIPMLVIIVLARVATPGTPVL